MLFLLPPISNGLGKAIRVVHHQPHYKPQVERLEQIRRHQVVKVNNEVRQKQNLKQEVSISEKLTVHREEFRDHMSAFQDMWGVHLG